MKRRKEPVKALLCLGGLFALSASTVTASEPGTFDRTFSVSGPVVVDVRSDPGGINIITSAETSSVRVHAVVRPLYGRLDLGLAEANIRALQQNPPIEQTGNRIRIGYAKPELLRAVSMTLEVQVPRDTQVGARTSSGAIKISGIAGPATTETSSGRTELSDIAGEVTVASHSGAVVIRETGAHVSVHNDSGSIQILAARGPINLQTTSGRIEVSDAAGEVRSTTHSGSISIDNVKGTVAATNTSGTIDAFLIAGPVQAQTKSGAIRISQINPASIRALTNSGAIKVDLASGRGYLIDAESNSGKVSGPNASGLPGLADAHHLKKQIGDGGPLIDLDSHSSRIEIN
jgi:hypothetical protein